MAFDIEMIKKVYKKYPEAVEAARNAFENMGGNNSEPMRCSGT